MLTDIFANRYSKVKLWDAFEEPQRRLLVQAFGILERLCPYWIGEQESPDGKAFWTDVHNRVSTELGLRSLSPLTYSYQTTLAGKTHTSTGLWSINKVCENWMLKEFDNSVEADTFIKERLSLIEIGFRQHEEKLEEGNADRPSETEPVKRPGPRYSGIRIPGDPDLARLLQSKNERLNAQFREAVIELNARLRNAGCDLSYHNGFIQVSSDSLVQEQVEAPFWALVAAPKWVNVDADMKEALNRRDTEARDPAFHAARALESVIKIVSDEKNCTRGKERGAHDYINNLSAERCKCIEKWEADSLKHFFREVRNPLGHGPGKDEMPELSEQQTDWAIETSMIWIRSLIRRL